MSTVMATRAVGNEEKTAGIEHCLHEIRDHLLDVMRRLDEEIRHYPTPIPRCDAQFNHLFEQRARLRRALERIDSANITPTKPIELLEEFVRSPAYLDEPAETELRARLVAELSRFAR